MAHAGNPTGLAKQPATSTTNGLWQALLVAVVLIALVEGMVIVSAGLAAKGAVSPAAIPAADHSLDQIEAQRGTVTLSTDANLNGIFDRAHAAPYVAGPALSTDEYLNNILDRAHAAPFAVGTVTPQLSATSGTFHPGWQPVAPIKRDRIGGE